MPCENGPIQTPASMNAAKDSASAVPQPSPGLAWLIVAFALLLRLLWLGMKPPHFDEGVNGWFIDQMTKQGYFSYDPGNYHGPFHFYVLFLAQTLFGRNIVVMRLPLVLVNASTVWLILQFRRFLPWRACVFAALAFAVSPGMLFYSRYAIHEAWLVFGMILAFWGAAELWTRGTARGLWAAAMGVTLMLLNKETHLIHLSAFGLAFATLAALEWLRISSAADSEVLARPVAQQWRRGALYDALAVSLLLLLFFYSGGFLDPAPWQKLAGNFFAAFAVWTKTGVHGTDHVKAGYYWIQLLLRYEWPVLLGVLWSARALWPGMDRFTRLLAIYGAGTLVAYSLVPYKTPWCVVSICWPFCFLFGVAVDSGMRFLREKQASAVVAWLPGLMGAVLLAASLAEAVSLNYFHPTEPGEKTLSLPAPLTRRIPVKWQAFLTLPSYVYVQTLNDYFKLTRPLEALIALNPEARHMPGNILLSSYHPLPWALGDLSAVGYYEKEAPPEMDAGFIVAEEDRIASVESHLKERYFVFPFQLRDAMSGGKLYLNAEWFAPVFPHRKPDFVPRAKTDAPAELPIVPAVPVVPTETPAVP